MRLQEQPPSYLGGMSVAQLVYIMIPTALIPILSAAQINNPGFADKSRTC